MDNLSNEYMNLSTAYSKGIQELNNKAWLSCEKILRDLENYGDIDGVDLQSSVFCLTNLISTSNDSNYRRIDLLGELLSNDLQLIPINKLRGTAHKEILSIVGSVTEFYNKNAYLIELE